MFNEYDSLDDQHTTLKILGFGKTGVPVQVWPGAFPSLLSATYRSYLTRTRFLKMRLFQAILRSSSATMAPKSLHPFSIQNASKNQTSLKTSSITSIGLGGLYGATKY